MLKINQSVKTPDGNGIIWGGATLPNGTMEYLVWIPALRRTKTYSAESLEALDVLGS